MTISSAASEPRVPESSEKAQRTSHPIALWFLFWGEFAERYSFYGMKTILLLYMTTVLHFDDGAARGWISYFKAAAYGMPLLGGFIADRFFGKYWTIVGFSVPYILGHVIIGFENVPCLLIALALLALGAGVVKPNTSTLMGMTYDQQRPGQTQLRSDAFAMFYVAINAGFFISSVAAPLLRDHYGYRIAFLFPAGLMLISFVLFTVGKPFYAKETARRGPTTPVERREQRRALRRLFGLFAVVAFFWSVMEQYDNTWVHFARDHVDLKFGLIGKPLDPDQFQSLNGVFIIVLVPIVAVVWHMLARAGIRLRPTDKMFIGFLLTLATPLIMAIAAALAGDAGRVSAWWLVLAYFVITLAEVCISVVGLELAFTAAPASMKSFITACWLLTLASGDILNAVITPYYDETISLGGAALHLTPTIFFGFFALLMVPVTISFVFIARRFNALS
jgi:POT family proton-dependent oligopeptide transporter